VLSWMLTSDLETLEANYPRSTATTLEVPPPSLVEENNDQDGDGRSDLEELIEGTGIDDATSFFQFEVRPGENSVEIGFAGTTGRSYRLEYSPDLTPDSWQLLEKVPRLDMMENILLLDQEDASRRFYQIVTDFP
ncbi:MAG: hypothetical protein AAF357_17310, partial [Verrucomicrobiota bacterium]